MGVVKVGQLSPNALRIARRSLQGEQKQAVVVGDLEGHQAFEHAGLQLR
jgi:hypothetical protein